MEWIEYHAKPRVSTSVIDGVQTRPRRHVLPPKGSDVQHSSPPPKVNITPFIDNLPFGKRTDSFCTADASGSTSQAASIIEALEVAVGFLRPSSTCRPGAC